MDAGSESGWASDPRAAAPIPAASGTSTGLWQSRPVPALSASAPSDGDASITSEGVTVVSSMGSEASASYVAPTPAVNFEGFGSGFPAASPVSSAPQNGAQAPDSAPTRKRRARPKLKLSHLGDDSRCPTPPSTAPARGQAYRPPAVPLRGRAADTNSVAMPAPVRQQSRRKHPSLAVTPVANDERVDANFIAAVEAAGGTTPRDMRPSSARSFTSRSSPQTPSRLSLVDRIQGDFPTTPSSPLRGGGARSIPRGVAIGSPSSIGMRSPTRSTRARKVFFADPDDLDVMDPAAARHSPASLHRSPVPDGALHGGATYASPSSAVAARPSAPPPPPIVSMDLGSHVPAAYVAQQAPQAVSGMYHPGNGYPYTGMAYSPAVTMGYPQYMPSDGLDRVQPQPGAPPMYVAAPQQQMYSVPMGMQGYAAPRYAYPAESTVTWTGGYGQHVPHHHPVATASPMHYAPQPVHNQRQRGGRHGSSKAQPARAAPAPAAAPLSPAAALLAKLQKGGSGHARRGDGSDMALGDIAGVALQFALDQHGSRFIQRQLEAGSSVDATIFDEILPEARSLMTHVFGNYVVQKFFDKGSTDQLNRLAEQFTGHVLMLSLHTYGCRVVQKGLEVLTTEQQLAIAAELADPETVLRCIKDQNGNHVMQKCVEQIPVENTRFIVDLLDSPARIFEIACHPYGCRVVQRVLEHCSQEQTAPILATVLARVPELVLNQYGNYIIQHVLEHGRPQHCSQIFRAVKDHVVEYSCHKYASPVVEKCLKFCNPRERGQLVDEVIAPQADGRWRTADGQPPLHHMVCDQFGNYVVQKLLDIAAEGQQAAMREQLTEDVLRRTVYRKHIQARLAGTASSPDAAAASGARASPRGKGDGRRRRRGRKGQARGGRN